MTAASVVPPGVWVDDSDEDDPVLRQADGTIVDTWREDYPYPERLERGEYDHHKRQLQAELLKLRYWVRDTGQRLVVLFEGRDAAGKGSTIKRFLEHLNPRGARVVALEVPTERERHEWYFERYVAHLPTAGEIVLFDRSWYNRAGVEPVRIRRWPVAPPAHCRRAGDAARDQSRRAPSGRAGHGRLTVVRDPSCAARAR